ncbi:hypothetical protein POM88_031487 [Heracleum sosnowskyi]|uniref:Uncharacterized protein n=1 Tax=Heracleum sosnowskyi TaxID=360622 RepID=A0AAD8HXJ3_9APIA|nr:hypothetical protein POM88_031487 [Heracleum sosnowskyi]
MSLASGVIPTSTFIYDCLYNDGGFRARTGSQKNFGFFHKNNFLPQSGVRIVTNQKLRLLKLSKIQRLCNWRDGFNHVAASVCAASIFNNSVGDFTDCGRVEGVKKEARNGDGLGRRVEGVKKEARNGDGSGRRVEGLKKEARNGDGSDTSASYGHGNGDSRGNHQGGGGNGGTGSGGQDESADWEELRWFCWQILKAWKYYNKLAKLRSYVVAGVGNIQVKIEGYRKEIVEPNFDGLEELLRGILELLLLPFALIAVAFLATLFAGILLFCFVVAILIWFWRRSRRP